MLNEKDFKMQYKVWYWNDGIEKILYHGPYFNRARRTARLWSKWIGNIETNFEL